MKNFKTHFKSFLKEYIINLIVINVCSLIFLFNTTSFDQGLLSLQSLFYSINKILVIIFVLIETVSSFLDIYGVTFKTLKIALIKFETLNLRSKL